MDHDNRITPLKEKKKKYYKCQLSTNPMLKGKIKKKINF